MQERFYPILNQPLLMEFTILWLLLHVGSITKQAGAGSKHAYRIQSSSIPKLFPNVGFGKAYYSSAIRARVTESAHASRRKEIRWQNFVG